MPRKSGGVQSHRQLDLFQVVGAIGGLEPSVMHRAGKAAETQLAVRPASPTAADAAKRGRAGRSEAINGPTQGDRGPHADPVRRAAHIRTLAVKDMPVYAPEQVAAATRSIKEARTDRVMLTYKEIDAFFGISRATVARRLKEGLVPGIRMQHGRVLEDGPVRRLDRTQLLYLLLAVRGCRS